MVVTSAARNVIALVALLCAAGCKDARPEQVVEPDLRRVNGEIADDILRAVSDTPPGSPAAFTVGLHAQGDSVSFSPSCRNTLHRSLREQLRVLSQATKLEWRESPPAEATVAFIVSSDGVEQSRNTDTIEKEWWANAELKAQTELVEARIYLGIPHSNDMPILAGLYRADDATLIYGQMTVGSNSRYLRMSGKTVREECRLNFTSYLVRMYVELSVSRLGAAYAGILQRVRQEFRGDLNIVSERSEKLSQQLANLVLSSLFCAHVNQASRSSADVQRCAAPVAALMFE